MKKIIEWIKAKLNIRSVVRGAVEKYYDELVYIEYENKKDLCVFGEKYKSTCKHARFELQASFLKFKISFLNSFL